MRKTLGLGFSDLALALERGALLHLEADGADRAGDDRRRGKPAGVEVAVSGHFPFDDGLFGLQVAFYGSVLADSEAPFGIDVSGNRSIENKIGGTVQITFDLDVAG